MLFFIFHLIVFVSLFFSTQASQNVPVYTKPNNAQKNLYTKKDLIATRDANLMLAIGDFHQGNYSSALATAIGTRSYAQQMNVWNLSAKCKNAISFVIAYSCLKIGSPQHGLSDLRKICNKLVSNQYPILTSHTIEKELLYNMRTLSREQTKLSNTLGQEVRYYQGINHAIAIEQQYKSLTNKTDNEIISLFKKPATPVEKAALLQRMQELAHNKNMSAQATLINAYKNGLYGLTPSLQEAHEYIGLYTQTFAKQSQSVPLEHFSVTAIFKELANSSTNITYLYYSFLDAIRNKNNAERANILNKLKQHPDKLSPLRKVFFNPLEDKNQQNNTTYVEYATLATTADINTLMSQFIVSDSPYIKPILKRLLAKQSEKSDAIHFLLGTLYFHNKKYQKSSAHFTLMSNNNDALVQSMLLQNQSACSKHTLESVLQGIKIIETIASNTKTPHGAVRTLVENVVSTCSCQYISFLLQQNDLEKALHLAHTCAQKELLLQNALTILKIIFTHIKTHNTLSNETLDKRLVTFLESKAFTAIVHNASKKQDRACLNFISWVKTEILLINIKPGYPITQDDCDHIERTLSAYEYTDATKAILYTVCSSFFYLKGNNATSKKDKIACWDKAIHYNCKEAVLQKIHFLIESLETKAQDIRNFEMQLTTIANNPGPLRAYACYTLAFLYYEDKTVSFNNTHAQDKIAFEHAQKAEQLGNREVRDMLGSLYLKGIKEKNGKWFLSPDYKKASYHFKKYLKDEPTHDFISYKLALSYYIRGCSDEHKYLTKALELFTTANLNTREQKLRALTLIGKGLVYLNQLDEPSSLVHAVHSFSAAKQIDPTQKIKVEDINPYFFNKLSTYLNTQIEANNKNIRFIQLCSYLGAAFVSLSNFSELGLKCLEHAARSNDLDALIHLACFTLSNESCKWRNICALEKALEIIESSHDTDHDKNRLGIILKALYPAPLYQKYDFIKYLAEHENIERVDRYLSSPNFLIYCNISELLEADDSLAEQCIADNILKRYRDEFEHKKTTVTIHGTLIYAYMLLTSKNSQHLLESSYLFKKIIDSTAYCSSIAVQQFLAVSYYKMALHSYENQPILHIAFLKKSADLGCIPAIEYIANQWYQNNQSMQSVQKTEVITWLKQAEKSETIMTSRNKQAEIKSLLTKCSKKQSKR